MLFRGNQFCNYYKDTLHSARKRPKQDHKNYSFRENFVIMSAGMVVYVAASGKMSGTKKEPKPKLLSPDIFWWGGGLPREGVGAKSSVCPSKPRESNFFGGISRDFAGISRKRPKSSRKKCFTFWPLKWSQSHIFGVQISLCKVERSPSSSKPLKQYSWMPQTCIWETRLIR